MAEKIKSFMSNPHFFFAHVHSVRMIEHKSGHYIETIFSRPFFTVEYLSQRYCAGPGSSPWMEKQFFIKTILQEMHLRHLLELDVLDPAVFEANLHWCNALKILKNVSIVANNYISTFFANHYQGGEKGYNSWVPP